MARGPAVCAGPLLDHQPACKPGSVGPARLALGGRDGHSSGTRVAARLEQPTRTAGLTSPCGVIARRRTVRVAVPIRSCSRWGLPCRLRCRIRGALLPHLFTLAARRPCGQPRRFVLCGTFPGVAPAGRYPAPHVGGARTFLPGDLSILAGAAVRPTDHPVMGARRREVKRRARFLAAAGRAGGRAWSASSGRRCRRCAPGGSGAGTPPPRPWSRRRTAR